jgi:hypothetical protein
MFNPEAPPELDVARWLNSDDPLSLAALKGKVVVMSVFQMLCPGSVRHALPQAARIAAGFEDGEVQVIGLHSVFEEHAKQGPEALRGFLEEHELPFPVAIDAADARDLPKTFMSYEVQGTPTVLIFDRQGRLRRHYLGQVDDIRLGAEVMALAMEDVDSPREASIAIERRLAAALTDPNAHHHHHDHEGGCCGGHHHDHDHDHDHHHDHAHAGGGCCGGGHGHHDHDHHHHDHAHHRQQHAHADAEAAKTGKGGCGGGGCGCAG